MSTSCQRCMNLPLVQELQREMCACVLQMAWSMPIAKSSQPRPGCSSANLMADSTRAAGMLTHSHSDSLLSRPLCPSSTWAYVRCPGRKSTPCLHWQTSGRSRSLWLLSWHLYQRCLPLSASRSLLSGRTMDPVGLPDSLQPWCSELHGVSINALRACGHCRGHRRCLHRLPDVSMTKMGGQKSHASFLQSWRRPMRQFGSSCATSAKSWRSCPLRAWRG
mmetsp:Transcript_63981/g.106103  ORF Transcript_63981/g.106103 Transcript_63981/m.106103 type:complete len:220 (-) Transcript_63981:2112-2771(-)